MEPELSYRKLFVEVVLMRITYFDCKPKRS